jgi:thioredoxin-dependent peroxiredoxin
MARDRKQEKQMLEVGKPAPAFALQDQNEKTVKLADFNGKWVVLYFYPKDDTPGCTIQACDFTAGVKGFEKLDAVVLGCSPDDAESHRKFIQKHKLAIPLLSDPDHATLEAYGAWGEKTFAGKTSMGVVRSTAIIDPEGKIAHVWTKVKPEGHVEEVRAKLEELKGGVQKAGK